MFIPKFFPKLPNAKEFRHIPPFKWRSTYSKSLSSNETFSANMKLNGYTTKNPLFRQQNTTKYVHHTMQDLLPWNQYKNHKPNLFSRPVHEITNRQSHVYQVQPCFTNQTVKKIVFDKLKAQMLSNPKETKVNIGIYDSNYFCNCPSCAKLQGSSNNPNYTFIPFANEIASRLNKEVRPIKVGVFAYLKTADPVPELSYNEFIEVQYCPIASCQVHDMTTMCESHLKIVDQIEGWQKNFDGKIDLWYYGVNFNNSQLSAPNFFNYQQDLIFYNNAGMDRIFMQLSGPAADTSWHELRDYLTSQLMWDLSIDVPQKIKIFLKYYYGEQAVPYLFEYLKTYQKIALKSNQHGHCHSEASDYGFQASDYTKLLKILKKARSHTTDLKKRKRIEKLFAEPYRISLEDFIQLQFKNKYERTNIPWSQIYKYRFRTIFFRNFCQNNGINSYRGHIDLIQMYEYWDRLLTRSVIEEEIK
ncbi:MAG: DUF4838 domain-containing protein [Lentisphaeria bacterium]|nr:DUF4838 domain-containing protein [Lentisphaeria bacterium]